MKNSFVCILATEIVGFNVLKGLENTFGKDADIRIMRLSERFISDVADERTEKIFSEIKEKVQNENWGKYDKVFLVCVGSIIANVYAFQQLKSAIKTGKIYLLVYNGKKDHYIIYDENGRMVYDYL